MPKVFISYVRQNSESVDKLADELRRAGVTVWLDREEIMPGADWQYAIRQAIKEGDYFIACFSAEYVARPLTYMSTEIGLAIDMLQQMPIGRIWFIPVLLSECEVLDLPISGGRTLSGLHREELYKDWESGVRRILWAMGVERPQVKPAPSKLAKPGASVSEQKAAVAPTEVIKVEAKPKPAVQVEPARSQPAKPVESAPPRSSHHRQTCSAGVGAGAGGGVSDGQRLEEGLESLRRRKAAAPANAT